MSFTTKNEKQNRMSFLDVHIIREDKKFTTSQFSTKYLDYADYLVNFELFYRNIHILGIFSNEDLDFVKTRRKEATLSSYRNYNNNVRQHLSKEEFLALQNYVQIITIH